MNLRVRAVLNAPPQVVWSVLADWERQAEWMPDVAWIRVVGEQREAGARLDVRTKVLGVPFTTDVMRVTGWERPRRLAIEHVGIVRGHGEWLLEPVGSRTRFTWSETLRMPPPVLGEIGLWLYAPIQRAMLKRSLRNLGDRVEGQTVPAAGPSART